MFGHETFFVNSHMFSGANVKGIFVHVGLEARDRALKEESGMAPFEPLEGTVMREDLLLKKPVYSDTRRLKKWLDLGNRYLLSLPPKKKKAPKKKQ